MGTCVQPRGSWDLKGLIYTFCCALQPAAAALQNASPQSSLTVEQRSEYADWFRKIGTDAQVTLLWFKPALHGDVNSSCVPAWNSALYCESRPDRMRDFFLLSYQASIEASSVPRVGCLGLDVGDSDTRCVFIGSLSYMCTNGSCPNFVLLIVAS